jgi:hypothetical protein
MMPAATALARSAAPSRSNWLQRAFRALLAALDRLIPRHGYGRDAELPLQWFKYPPI